MAERRFSFIPANTDDSERDFALPFSCRHPLPNTRAWLIMMMLEATALGIVAFKTMDAVMDRVGGPRRAFRRALMDLEQSGLVAFTQEGAVTIAEIDGRKVQLLALSPWIVDDPWQITRAKVFATKGASCHYCGGDASQVDHVVPRAQGGSDELENLVPACASCNHDKGNRTPQQWRSAR